MRLSRGNSADASRAIVWSAPVRSALALPLALPLAVPIALPLALGLVWLGVGSLGACSSVAKLDDQASGGANTGGASAGGASAGGAGGAPTASCETYCTLMMDQCQASATGGSTLQQYASRDACLATCKHFPQGAPGADTLDCRATEAVAAAEPEDHCVSAGPSGGDVCGSVCDAYCSQLLSICTGAVTLKDEKTAADVANIADCKRNCSGIPRATDAGGQLLPYNAKDFGTSGNNLNCRLFHVGLAAISAPGTHCRHALGMAPCD